MPPDAFSADGQLWGNPVYRWDEMKKNGYRWWKERIRKALALFDAVRIDHFRGFDRYFSIPQDAQTAREGEWKDGPKEALFEDMKNLPIVAEDLGVIDEGVLRLMKNVGYPGMRVLEFAFDGNADNTNKPSNSPENSVAYTGTHDNPPFAAYVRSLPESEKQRFVRDFRDECKKFGVDSAAVTPKNIAPMRYGSRLLLRRIFAWRRCTICWRSAKKPASTRRPRFQQKTGVSAIRKRSCYRRKSKKRFCALRLSIADKKNTRDKNRRRTFPFRTGVYAVRGGIFYAESGV